MYDDNITATPSLLVLLLILLSKQNGLHVRGS